MQSVKLPGETNEAKEDSPKMTKVTKSDFILRLIIVHGRSNSTLSFDRQNEVKYWCNMKCIHLINLKYFFRISIK